MSSLEKKSIIWFRQDLRVNDHTALWYATQSQPCIALVILSAQQWQHHDDAIIKIDFYLRQLQALKQQLNRLNIPLHIELIPLWQDIAVFMQKFCLDQHITQVYANIDLGLNELQRDAQVQQSLQQIGKDLLLYHDRTLFPVASIRNQANQPYQVFSAFKRQCIQRLIVTTPQPFPQPQPQKPLNLSLALDDQIPTLAQLCHQSVAADMQALWPVGEDYAQQKLQHFIADELHRYHLERDFPANHASSGLSAYLNIGILSIRQCLFALFQHEHGQFQLQHAGQEMWLNELLWREFYQHILYDYPRLSRHQPFKLNTQHIAWRDDTTDFDKWKMGKTGIPIIDAGMRQLLATGWMHNRVRMIVAMFLSKNLLIDWRLGEQWFMQHLIDGDLAANNGGWQWCASTGTDAVPYFRIFNPISQSKKFDPQGDYIRQWLPELATLDHQTIHEPYAKNPPFHLDYPQPMLDLKQSRLDALAAFKAI